MPNLRLKIDRKHYLLFSLGPRGAMFSLSKLPLTTNRRSCHSSGTPSGEATTYVTFVHCQPISILEQPKVSRRSNNYKQKNKEMGKSNVLTHGNNSPTAIGSQQILSLIRSEVIAMKAMALSIAYVWHLPVRNYTTCFLFWFVFPLLTARCHTSLQFLF